MVALSLVLLGLRTPNAFGLRIPVGYHALSLPGALRPSFGEKQPVAFHSRFVQVGKTNLNVIPRLFKNNPKATTRIIFGKRLGYKRLDNSSRKFMHKTGLYYMSIRYNRLWAKEFQKKPQQFLLFFNNKVSIEG
jgi:hypothetical protein